MALPYERWLTSTARSKFREITHDAWNAEFAPLSDYTLAVKNRRFTDYFIDTGSILATVQFTDAGIDINVASNSQKVNASFIEDLRKKYPIIKGTSKELPITIWAYGGEGPEQYNRSIAVPTMEEIVGNYPTSIRTSLSQMAEWKPPIDHGRIMLWRGEPGTGKTFAIRALANAWRDWCTMHYIADPETFFGAKPSYMLQVAIGNSDGKHRLLVLEDSGELISLQAKAQTGQGLSRLLNLADGILGQGLKTLILITTNEDIDKLDKAIVRPGRSLGTLDFKPLDPVEANDWLVSHNILDSVNVSKKIAELYELANGHSIVKPEEHKIGFGGIHG